jgi:hypothetical protein
MTRIMFNNDPNATWMDVARPRSLVSIVLVLQMSALEICSAWIHIGGSGGKKNVKTSEYPKDLR